MHAGRCLLIVALLVMVCGCAESAARSSGAGALKPPPETAENVTGVWQGRSIASCPQVTMTDPGRCDAMQRITFTMFQDGRKITGSYRCGFGNQNCRDLAENGVIRNGRMVGRLLRMRVMLDDGSMCFFNAMPHNDILKGSYACQWGGPIERGFFQAERSY